MSPSSRLVGAKSVFALFVTACAAPAPRPPPAPTEFPAPPPAGARAEAASGAAAKTPGGMWMPEQIPTQAEALKRLGLAIDPALLADPLSGILASIVNMGGCSAAFISAEG